jgi:hypothetical protein
MRHWTIVAALLAIASSGLSAGPGGGFDTPDELLERAQMALGGVSAFHNIRNIVIEGELVWTSNPHSSVTPFGYTIVPPDRFQSRTKRVAHTLAGDRFWQNVENPDAVRQIAKRNTQQNFVIWSLIFLVEPPKTVPTKMTILRSVSFGQQRAIGIHFETDDGMDITLVLDPQTAHPVGCVQVTALQSSSGTQSGPTKSEWRFENYRRVGGIDVPFTIERQINDWSSRSTFTSIRTNVPGVEATFEKR